MSQLIAPATFRGQALRVSLVGPTAVQVGLKSFNAAAQLLTNDAINSATQRVGGLPWDNSGHLAIVTKPNVVPPLSPLNGLLFDRNSSVFVTTLPTATLPLYATNGLYFDKDGALLISLSDALPTAFSDGFNEGFL